MSQQISCCDTDLSADVCVSLGICWCDTDLSADVYESTDMCESVDILL